MSMAQKRVADELTKKLLENILEDEQEHHHTFTMLLEDL